MHSRRHGEKRRRDKRAIEVSLHATFLLIQRIKKLEPEATLFMDYGTKVKEEKENGTMKKIKGQTFQNVSSTSKDRN